MPYLKTYNLFISHAWAYGESYHRLVNLLNQAPYFFYIISAIRDLSL